MTCETQKSWQHGPWTRVAWLVQQSNSMFLWNSCASVQPISFLVSLLPLRCNVKTHDLTSPFQRPLVHISFYSFGIKLGLGQHQLRQFKLNFLMNKTLFLWIFFNTNSFNTWTEYSILMTINIFSTHSLYIYIYWCLVWYLRT